MPEVPMYEPSTSRTSLPYHSLLNPKIENDEAPYLGDSGTNALQRKFLYGVMVGLLSGLAVILFIYATFSYIFNSTIPRTFPPDCEFLMILFCLMQAQACSVHKHSYQVVSSHTVTFQKYEIFEAAPSPDTDAAWDNLMPAGRGFILVEEPEKYGLRPGLPTLNGPDRYSVSGVIRESYYSTLLGTRPHIHGDEKLSDAAAQESDREHTGHCFDYLRQAIMCSADMTIEWAEEVPEGKAPFSVDGWGIPHMCRNWEGVLKWMGEHRSPANFSGIA
ncbi:hypothetical protein NHQ30_010873 [Ciborinia camelliae]|nr:hypothetical protein NHQ30_010873 [Ciborinia camelliae]